MQTQEISVSDIDLIAKYIKSLSYAGHGCLSLYWKICQKKSINARFFIDVFAVGSRAFRSKYHLWSSDENYRENRWKWVRKILIKLENMGFIDIKHLRGHQPLGLNPASKFKNADYSLRPRISKLAFKFPSQDGETTINDIASAHKFIMHFISRHIPPRYYPTRLLKRSFQSKIEKAKGIVIICFPITE